MQLSAAWPSGSTRSAERANGSPRDRERTAAGSAKPTAAIGPRRSPGAPSGSSTAAARSIRGKLGAAACALLASAAPRGAPAAEPAATNQVDLTSLIYGEAQRVTVVEPNARFTRLYPDGESLYGEVGLDVITGASPSGAVPTGKVQTITTASGRVVTRAASEIPTSPFSDTRVAVDGGWVKPFWLLTPTLTVHFSREKDYQSLGATGKLSFDLPDRLTTLTGGGGYNQDEVFPSGGITLGLADPTLPETSLGKSRSKRVVNGIAGVSRVLTRRWLVGVTGSYTSEQGYLTEPYKVLSLVDPLTGLPTAERTESRPTSRSRFSVLGSSVYHFDEDVLHLSYRYYGDDWSIRSHTVDLAYRAELGGSVYLEPHLRYYTQSAASFFRFGLVDGEPLPEFATSDYRVGPLDSVTVGATLGFRVPHLAGEWSARAEYLGQFPDGHPADAIGIERTYDLYPVMNIGSLVLTYEIKF
ncbi:MAG: DUF3570 domain-containing protein [bacterium]